MENLKKAAVKLFEDDLKKSLSRIEIEDGLNQMMQNYNKKYKKNAKQKFIKFITQYHQKIRDNNLKLIEEVNNSKDFGGEFIITVEWRASRMWRSNPKSFTNYGFESRSIGGCGYDKLSTATAEALNSHLPFLKLLYTEKDKKIKNFLEENKDKDAKNGFNREVLGYGSGYNILPHFEGGVGVSCHMSILKNLGIEMRQITDAKNTDVFLIKRMEAQHE